MNLKKIYTIRYLFYLIIIVLVSTYLILLTYGYRINWDNFSLQKISMMYLASIPQDAEVYLNSHIVSQSTPIKIANLFPGRYDVKIVNDKYIPWEKTFFVEADYVAQEQDIVLILKDKAKINLSEDEIKSYQIFLNNKKETDKYNRGLVIKNDTEIYFEDIFITRFSKEVKNITWYADKKHIIYQLGNEVYFMDTDGTNNIKLAELSSSDSTKFMSSKEGKYLIYEDSDEVKKIQITNISSLFKEKYFNKAGRIIK